MLLWSMLLKSQEDWRRCCHYIPNYLLATYLFTRSDLKTILLPVTIFSSILAPLHSYPRLAVTVIWTWLHLLHFCISNQCISVAEDLANKPWRPICSGRVSLRQASAARHALAPVCLYISLSVNQLVFAASGTIIATTWLYNDLGFHGHWLGKNCLNVIGYIAFGLGATAISEKDHLLLPQSVRAALVLGLIILTTVHAGDFPDVIGDMQLGRRTIPIAFPGKARITLAASLIFWSLYGTALLSSNFSFTFIHLLPLSGVYVAWRFMVYKRQDHDKFSSFLYQLWLSGMHLVLAQSARCDSSPQLVKKCGDPLNWHEYTSRMNATQHYK